MKHGGRSVLVWGRFQPNTICVDIVRIDVFTNMEMYKLVLIHHAIPFGKHLIGNGFIFQPNNDPKHTAYTVKLDL